MKLFCSKTNPPLGGLIAVEYLKSTSTASIQTRWADETYVEHSGGKVNCNSAVDALRVIARLISSDVLYGTNALEKTEIDHWLTFSISISWKDAFAKGIKLLNKHLAPLTYLVGKRFTIADCAVFSALYLSPRWQNMLSKNEYPTHVFRWYNFILSNDWMKNVIESLPVEAKSANDNKLESSAGDRQQEGKFVDLPGAEMGKVVVRFPPEASGYLHIGHAKAALLNQYYQQTFQGKLIMRFDDTNPAKENVHFEKVILEDVEMLQIKPDMFTHTSQYFDLMLEYCEKLLKEGKAYVDDTEPEKMKQEREQKIESINRSNSYEKNYSLWQEMKKGTEIGQKCCVRAKIDMQSPNGCMRDPTIYRCKNEPHPRTGDKYKVYPTYDFACPIVDAIEGVTHTLRTMEYHDRDAQFYWFIEALGLRKPYIWEYSRLSMTNTVLSKRKLAWFVEQKLVDGWDDPRFPTVRGVLRRGMTVEGLKQFIIAQGSSRSVVFMEWDKIWAFNKKVIDPIAPRYTAVDRDSVVVNVSRAEERSSTVPKHPKNSDIGTKEVWTGPKVLIDRVDADALKEGENATFINWGNLTIRKINKGADGKVISVDAETNLDNKDYKKTLKLTWLAVTDKAPFTPTYCVYFEHIISKPLLGKDEDFKKYIGHTTRVEVETIGDPELKKLKKGDIIQLQRKGFFIVDVAYGPADTITCKEQPVVLFHIPDGHTKENPIANVLSKSSSGEVSINTEQTSVSESAHQGQVNAENDLLSKIATVGDKIRDLKSKKADKSTIDAEVKVLLSLKSDYKTLTGKEWKPVTVKSNSVSATDKKEKSESKTVAPSGGGGGDVNALLERINVQGNKVRDLKSKKAEKSAVDAEVKVLLSLKMEYKTLTGKDWKPDAISQVNKSTETKPEKASNDSAEKLREKIAAQEGKVRDLKAAVDTEIQRTLQLKEEYKNVTGNEWKSSDGALETSRPQVENQVENNSPTTNDRENIILDKIATQGDKVRELKSKKADKSRIDEEVKLLLSYKSDYKALTGKEWKPGAIPKAKSDPTVTSNEQKSNKTNDKPNKTKVPKAQQQSKEVQQVSEQAQKKQTRLGMEAKKGENLAEWYSQVITKGDLIEYYDVSGCYVFRPWAYAVWEAIKDWFDKEIKKLDVENCYFPMFVSQAALEKEKTHIADFAPEVAWVTKSGNSEMAEPIAIRPTSETVMYPTYAKWVQSFRDLPIKLNQWNNVVRWEFKHPQPFLRTREFLWQEGHTAYTKKADAEEEVLTIINLYAKIYTDLLAIPVVMGRKTEKEKFAGGDYTYTVEAFISASGRAIQGATSHHLGQNFSRMFEIVYEDAETQEKEYAYQNSWGITTRTIGVMVMVHADDRGLVLPPNVARYQVVVVPCGITVKLTDGDRDDLHRACSALEKELKDAGMRVKGDYRDNYSPGWKFNHWELKGVPVRVELGPKDIKNSQLVAVRRDTGEKITIKRNVAVEEMKKLLEDVHRNLYSNACKDLKEHTVLTKDWAEFTVNLDRKNIILSPFCGDAGCEERIKADSARGDNADPGAPSMGAKSLCIPTDQPAGIEDSDKCIHPDCKNKPLYYTLFGRSY